MEFPVICDTYEAYLIYPMIVISENTWNQYQKRNIKFGTKVPFYKNFRWYQIIEIQEGNVSLQE